MDGDDGEVFFEAGYLSSCKEVLVDGEKQTKWLVAFPPQEEREYDLKEEDYGMSWYFVVDAASPAPVPPSVPPPPEAPSAAQPTAAPVSSDAKVFWYANKVPMQPGYTAVRDYDSLLLRPGKRCGP